MTDVDVAVVGAGFAGLTAARRLAESGAGVAVLEARDRVGGRTHTIDVDGVALDMGGMWVGPGQTYLKALAAELGVRTTPQVMVGENVIVLEGRALRGGAVELPPESLRELAAATRAFEELSRRVSPTEPWNDPEAGELDSITLSSWLDERLKDGVARSFFETTVNSVFATQSSNLSALAAAAYAAAGGGWRRLIDTEEGAQQARLVGGVEQMARALAERLGESLRLGSPVSTIRCGNDAAVAGPGLSLTARRVIVALPPTLAGRITYDPPLPAERDQLTQRVPAGSVIKFHAVYESAWWRSDGLSGQVLGPGAPVGVTFDTSPPGRGVITGFFEGSHAVWASTLSTEERGRIVCEHLALALGERALGPSHYVDCDWSSEPWTRGCYAGHFPPGVWTAFGPALREPCGLIHWAGTETARQWTGYIDGAIESGERVAAEVLAALG